MKLCHTFRRYTYNIGTSNKINDFEFDINLEH